MSSGNGFWQQTFPFLCFPELPLYLSHSNSWLTNQLRVKVTLGSTVSQPDWCPRPNVYYCLSVTGLLMWGWVCYLQLLMALLVQSFLGPSTMRHINIFYCLRLETPWTCRVKSVFLSPRKKGGPVTPPRHWVLFSKVVHRWRCNLDTTLQANTRVCWYNLYIYIYIFRCKNTLLRFDGREMALVVNGKHVVPSRAHRGLWVAKQKKRREQIYDRVIVCRMCKSWTKLRHGWSRVVCAITYS
jgi:hypothetical protein